jgi:hypothetical protein
MNQIEEFGNFLDELLAEAEQNEELQTESYFDLQLIQLREIKSQITNNFSEAEKEIKIINDWVIRKNLVLQERMKFIELRLEAFIKERNVKTLDLPNGVLKLHKKPDKVEIEDMELFLQNAKPEMLTVVPETIKPDLNKIKSYVKTHLSPPLGISITKGKEEFSYKLIEREEIKEYARKEETGVGSESTNDLRVAV